VVEIKKTDSNGKVTTTVQQFGDDFPWHAGKSKWSAGHVANGSKGKIIAQPVAPVVPVVTAPAKLPAPPVSFGQSTAFSGESVAWEQLPSYYHTFEEKEKLKASQASHKIQISLLKTVEDFKGATKKIYSKWYTSNANYGYWYRT
jgi:hypothetical protein